MKKIIILSFFALLIMPVFAQVTRVKLTPRTYEDYAAPLRDIAEQHRKAYEMIQELKHSINDYLAYNIDDELRELLNDEYDYLDDLESELEESGINNTLLYRIKRTQKEVNSAVRKYNNRVARAKEEIEAAQRQAAEEAKRETAKPKEWSGTGFALNNGYVVTNYHVVENAKSINISGINGDFSVSYNASVVVTDNVNDLAIVKIRDRRFNGFGSLPYAIEMQMAEVGDDVFVLGYPLTQTMGDEIKLTNGIISSRTGFQGDASLYQMSAPVQHGNSGGPMFDRKGNVIGIVCARHPGTETAGYAIKTSYLKNLVESSSLQGIFPRNNTISNLSLSDKVKKLKRYVFLIKCSNSTSSTGGSYQTSIESSNGIVITNVNRSSSETEIKIKMNCKGKSICIDPDTYIIAGNTKYKLVSIWGIDYCPRKTDCQEGISSFTLIFPAIPYSTTHIDLIVPSNSNWNKYGIPLQ